jgi:hypothetical protein
MPPLALHTAIAKEVADRLRLPLLDAQRGHLYLGSTAPDIRILTRWERARTHFFDLDSFDEQSGVQGLFSAHPDLSQPWRLNEATAAFVAGYVTHLVMDEGWIGTIYRPYFGEKSPLGGSIRANVMDRALQFWLDADRRHDRKLMEHVMSAVAAADLGLDIQFIDPETIRRWRDLVTDLARQMPDWGRFAERAKRHLGLDEDADDAAFNEAIASLPDLVGQALDYLGSGRIDAYLRDSIEECIAAVKDYFECE